MNTFHRVRALIGIASSRIAGRFQTAPYRILLTVAGVALAIGLMVAVTGVSLGVASESVITNSETDYWIVPEDANVQTLAVSAGGVQLSEVHDTSARIMADDRVEYAIPVLLELIPVRDTVTGDRKYLLAVGVVAQADSEILGMSLDPLEVGDPYYADGGYNGTWTGDAVLNQAAAQSVNASLGTALNSTQIPANRSLSVVNVSDSESSNTFGSVPMAVVHISELQAITGATTGDQADQILVSTDDPAVQESLASIYPQTTVVERNGLGAQEVSTENLALAIAVSGALTAVVIGILFVTTLMGLAVSSNRQSQGMLAAIGISRRSRSVLVAAETVFVALIGGFVGIAIGIFSILVINRAGQATLGTGTVATFDVRLIGYAIGVAFIIGLVGAIYPILLSRRTSPLEVLSR